MKKRIPEDRAFAAQIAVKFREAIKAHKLTREAAAEKLGVKRATIFKYLSGKTIPGSHILGKACQEWGIVLDYRGLQVQKGSFKPQKAPIARQTVQLELPFMEETLKGENMTARVRTKGSNTVSVTLEVRIAS